MKRQTIGKFIIPFAYIGAGVVMIVGFVFIVSRTGIIVLIDAAVESMVKHEID